jgi:UPF0755 protein
MSREDRGGRGGRLPRLGRRARPERDEATDPYGQYGQGAGEAAQNGRYAGPDGYPHEGAGYPPGYGHDGAAHPREDGYSGQHGYGGPGYGGQDGYPAQNGYAGDVYGGNGQAGRGGYPGAANPVPDGYRDDGYPAADGYPAGNGYSGQAGYPGQAVHPGGGAYPAGPSQRAPGPGGADRYPADDSYAGQDGYPAGHGYPAGPGYPPDGSYPAGPGYPPDRSYPASDSYPAADSYPTGPGFAADDSYPAGGGFAPGPGFAPDDSYPAGQGYPAGPDGSYAAGPGFAPGQSYGPGDGGDPEASGPYRWQPPAAEAFDDGAGDDPAYPPGAGQHGHGYQDYREPAGPHGYPGGEPDAYHQPDGYHAEPDGYDDAPAGYHGQPDGYRGEPDGYHDQDDELYQDGQGPRRPPGGRGGPYADAPHGLVPGLGRGSGSGAGGAGRPPRRRRPMRRIAPLIAVVVVLGLLITGGVYALKVYRGRHANYAGGGSGTVIFQVKPGDGPDQLAPELVKDGVIAAAAPFIAAADASNTTAGLQPGYFRLHRHMSATAAYQALINPKLAVQANVTIPEGLRAINVVGTLGAHSKIPGTSFSISESQYAQALKDTKALGLPSYANGNPEGYLFPATYPVTPGSTATSVLQAMVARFKQEASSVNLPAWAKRDHFTQAQIITEASLIQAEGGRVKDFGKIARVIDNRLVQHINLQLDSTVFYALNKYGIAASADDLKVKSPYNTYTHPDLPPGPIDSPGDAAIKAALHPATGDWLYFVTVNPKTGETKFTDSESQFEAYQAELHDYLATHGGG